MRAAPASGHRVKLLASCTALTYRPGLALLLGHSAKTQSDVAERVPT